MRHRRTQLDTAWPGRRSIALAVGGLIVAATAWWLTVRDPLQVAGAQVAAPSASAASGPTHPSSGSRHAPARGLPARFTGAFTESIDAGSLVIHAGVEVVAPGRYVIDGNLLDAAEQPVASSRFAGELAAGVHDADLVFSGRVLRDGNARGPFHLGRLRGARHAPGPDPALEPMPPFTGTYTTRPYPAGAFSDAGGSQR